MNNTSMAGFTRVSKQAAQKLFDSGAPFYIVGSKVNAYHITGGWHIGMQIEPDRYRAADIEFDKMIDQWSWYNANYELGYYPAFYTRQPSIPLQGPLTPAPTLL